MRHYAEIGPYSEAGRAKGIDWDTADLMGASLPFRVREDMERAKVADIKVRDADLYDRLEKSGFMVTFGHDETGLLMQYMRTASGYYIDVGGSDLVASGEIKVKTNVGVDSIEADGVRLTSGELLPADVIIYATGYGPMEDWARELISPEAAEKIGHVWGVGSGARGDPGPWEGELRNMWKPTALEGVWFHGGNLQQSRFHSMHVALQIKARMEGLPVKVYRE
jgi:putative flavoprotein involved in K+ transport